MDILGTTCYAIVNPVNCVGPMGAGLAKALNKRFPGLEDYHKAGCALGCVSTGRVIVWQPKLLDKMIINFPTKQHYKNASDISWIKTGMIDLIHVMVGLRIDSVAIPGLGCGLGGLSFSDVYPIIIGSLSEFDTQEHQIEIYPPSERDGTVNGEWIIPIPDTTDS